MIMTGSFCGAHVGRSFYVEESVPDTPFIMQPPLSIGLGHNDGRWV